jgi:8-oxo-dGTP pyrophosphatase MutT (NUDIX family)
MNFQQTLDSALQLDVPYSSRTQRELPDEIVRNAIPAAVLLLFGFSQSDPDQSHLLFIRRTDSVETHKGQMAFPGGHCEPQDLNSSVTTALRETEEELGIPVGQVLVIGALPTLLTVSGFSISPVVGILKPWVEDTLLKPDPSEIAEALWIPFKTLVSPGTYRYELIQVGTQEYPIDVYQVQNYRIWGATGSMTKNMLDRLAALR